MTESPLATAAVWSYGLAAVAYLVFAARLALGWRRSSRAMLLMAASLATVLWAAADAAVARWPLSAAWPAAIVFDSIRYASGSCSSARCFRAPAARRTGSAAPSVPRWIVG